MNIRNVVLVGPDKRGIGGIESVLRSYGSLDLEHYTFEWLSTWSRTVPGSNGFGAFPRALGNYIIRMHRWVANRPLFHVHFSHKGSFLREGLFLVLARLSGFEAFATVHGSAFVRTANNSIFWRWTYRTVLSFASRVSVLNADAFDSVHRLGVGKVVVMNNPGPVSHGEDLPRAGACPPVAVFAGSVGRRKGVDTLLRAWDIVLSEVPNATLYIVGPAQDADVVEAAGNYWVGPMKACEVIDLPGSSRLAVLPSTAEAMPMFLIEAMGCGRPLIVTNVGAMATQAEDCGIVLGVGDVDALASALIAYLSDEARANRDGQRALSKYDSLYGPRAVKLALDSFYACNL